MMELLQKRAEMVQQIKDLQDRIGLRQGQQIDADMHIRYLDMYKNEDESPYKRQRIEESDFGCIYQTELLNCQISHQSFHK